MEVNIIDIMNRTLKVGETLNLSNVIKQ